MAENIDVNVNVKGNANAALQGLNNDLNKVSQSFANLRNIIAGLAIGSFVNNLLNASAALVDLSKATGLTLESVKGLSDALEANGGNAEKSQQILVKFTERLDEAREGSRQAQQAFAGVGISLKDLQKPNSELALQFAENVGRMAEFEGEARAAGAAAEVTGKGIRTIDLKGFGADARSAVDAAKGYTGAITQADQVQQQLEKTIKKAKDELLLFLKPVLDVLATEEGWKSFTTTLKTLGIILGIMFGAKMIKNLIDFNKQLRETEIIGSKLGKNPLLRIFLVAGGLKGLEMLSEKLGIFKDEAIDVDAELKKAQQQAEQTTASTTAQDTGTAISTRETDNLTRAIKDKTSAYDDQVEAIRKNIKDQINLLKVGKDQSELDKVRSDIEEKAADAVKKFNEEKAKLDPKKDADLIAVINAQIDAINKGKEASVQAAQDEIRSLQQLQRETAQTYAQMEVSVTEFQNAVKNDEALQQLRDQAELVGKYGQELEILQAKQRIDQELRQRNNELIGELVRLQFDLAKAIREGNSAEEEAIRIKIAGVQRVMDAEKTAAEERKKITVDNIKNNSAMGKSVLDQMIDSIAKTKAELEKYNLGDSIVQNLNQAIDNFVQTGKFKFKEFAANVLKEWLAVKAKMSLMDVLDQLAGGLKNAFAGISLGGGGGGGFWGTILRGIGSIFGFAEGGRPPINKPSIVGEKGPELFVPRSAGTVIPNDMLTAGTKERVVTNNYITNNISALDAKSVAQLFAENRKTLLGVTETARREMAYGT